MILTSGSRKRGGSTIYRHGYSPGVYRLLAGVFVALAAFLLFYPPLSLWQLVFVPGNLALAGLAWRMSRMGVQLDGRGVRVNRMIRTIRIPWPSVALGK